MIVLSFIFSETLAICLRIVFKKATGVVVVLVVGAKIPEIMLFRTAWQCQDIFSKYLSIIVLNLNFRWQSHKVKPILYLTK